MASLSTDIFWLPGTRTSCVASYAHVAAEPHLRMLAGLLWSEKGDVRHCRRGSSPVWTVRVNYVFWRVFRLHSLGSYWTGALYSSGQGLLSEPCIDSWLEVGCSLRGPHQKSFSILKTGVWTYQGRDTNKVKLLSQGGIWICQACTYLMSNMQSIKLAHVNAENGLVLFQKRGTGIVLSLMWDSANPVRPHLKGGAVYGRSLQRSSHTVEHLASKVCKVTLTQNLARSILAAWLYGKGDAKNVSTCFSLKYWQPALCWWQLALSGHELNAMNWHCWTAKKTKKGVQLSPLPMQGKRMDSWTPDLTYKAFRMSQDCNK